MKGQVMSDSQQIEKAAQIIARAAVESGNIYRFTSDEAARALADAGMLVTAAEIGHVADERSRALAKLERMRTLADIWAVQEWIPTRRESGLQILAILDDKGQS